jgi:hypothetical protein
VKLWMSAEIQADVDEAYRAVRKGIETSVNELLENASFLEKFEEWNFIAIILKVDSQDYAEVVKRSSRGKAMEFRLKIPHEAFLTANQAGKTRLVLNALSRSVARMNELNVSSGTQATLQKILAQVGSDKQNGPQ